VISIRIIAWDSQTAWTSFAGYHPRALERRLMSLTARGRGEVKRLARRLKRHECFTLPLPAAVDRFAADSLRSLLESLGAVLRVNEVEQTVAPEGTGPSDSS
jgi:hypothetical protein